MLTSTGSPSSAQLPTYGIDPLWQLHEDSKSTDRSGDLSDIIFNLRLRAELPTPSSIANSFSPSLPRSEPITIPSFTSRVDLGCNPWEDLVSTSSSSSQFSPLPGATNLSSSNSVNSKKSGADAVHSKIRPFPLPKRQRSLESGSRQIYGYYEPSAEAVAHMKEMIYRAAVMRPVNLGREVVEEKPKRRNVRISNDPQTTAARQRRERLSERLRVLQRLVPGGTKMDTATMLDEAANYLKYLKSQITIMERVGNGAVDAKISSLSEKNPYPVLNFKKDGIELRELKC